MQKFQLIILLLVTIQLSFSQIVLNNSTGQIEYTCSEQFTLTSNHNAGDIFTLTVCDSDPNTTHVSAAFSSWSFGGGDYVDVFDGTDSSYPLLGSFNESNFMVPWAMTASPSNMTGCLTFVFHSNGGGSNFESTFHCQFNCQFFNAVIDSTDHQINNGLYIDVCQGSTITFYGSGDYTYNGGLYTQSDANSTFTWDFGDGTPTQTGEVVTHTFPVAGGGFQIDLKVTDQYGCENMNDVDLKVRQSMTPEWTLGTTTICPGEQVAITGAAASPPMWDNTPTTIVAGQTYLPDGNGSSYQTTLLFDVFGNQTLDSLSMLESFCINMEHSFIGDLVMQITCPNGTTITFESQAGGGTYLGVPIDVEDPNQPGVGYDYCWGPNPTYGEMGVEASNYSTLPAGTYTSHDNLSGLLGCPLNGVWTITVTDNWGADDGFIFSWGINFAPWVFPNYWGFQNTIVDYQWSGENVIGYQGSEITVAPTTEGQVCYDVTVTDDFGCTYDTTTCITVRPASDPICYCETPPTTISFQNPLCFGENITFNYTGTANINTSTFVWNFGSGTVVTGDINGDGPIVVSYPTSGDFTVSLNVKEGICVPTSANFTVTIPQQLTSLISGTNNLCFGDASGTIDLIVTGGTAPISYYWSNSSITEDLANLTATTYFVVSTDANGCTIANQYEVTEPPLLQISNTSNTNLLCFGDGNGTITVNAFGGTGNLEYTDGNSIQINNGLFTNLSGGTYIVTITDNNSCSIVSNPIYVNEPPLLQFSNKIVNNILCNGEQNGLINATIIGGTPNYYYYINNTLENDGLFTGLSEGNYSIFVKDENNCSLYFDTVIIEPNLLIADIPAKLVICEGESINITASVTGGTPSYSYHWGHTMDNVQSTVVSPIVDTEYYLYITDANNCISETFKCLVLVSPNVSLIASSNLDSICPGDPITITSQASEGNGFYTYLLNGDTINSEETLYPLETIDYTVSVIDGCGKIASVIVPIFVNDIPSNNFYPDKVEGCEPLSVSFIETSAFNGQTFSWDFGDDSPENIGTQQNPIHIYENSGVFDVSLTVTSKEGCTNTLHQYGLIHVYKKPVAKFLANPDIASIIKPIIEFNNLSGYANNYIWSFGDGDSSFVNNPIHNYNYNFIGDYNVELIAITDKGCRDTVKSKITIREEYTFYAPTAFSPDNDRINDVFLVKGSGIDLDNFKLLIYDRWGEIIFTSSDIYEGWNGIAKNHKKVQNGVYTWQAIYLDSNGIEHSETGNVTVIY